VTEEAVSKAKDPDDLDGSPNAEAKREGQMWVKLANSRGLNADMVVRTAHTDTQYVWVIDRSLAGGA